jgi:hypothetical protein
MASNLRARNVGGALAIREQAVVTDAVEALGQHMDEETGLPKCAAGCKIIKLSGAQAGNRGPSANSITRCCVRIKPPQRSGESAVIKMRRAQLSFGDGPIHEEVEDLREDWMAFADQVLEDEQLVATVYEALAKRHPHSRCRGRPGTPAEVVLRLLILKHVRNWVSSNAKCAPI